MHLTPGQRGLLEQTLRLRQHELQSRQPAQKHGQSRVEHAQALATDGADDEPQRAADREVSQALGDLGERELTAVGEALQRLSIEAYGRCADCDANIPFDRLKLEPWALRCVACESQRESAMGGARHAKL